MTDKKLEVELEALGRLSADLRELSEPLISSPSTVASNPDIVPTMLAAWAVLNDKIPALRNIIGERLNEVADLIDRTRTELDEINDDRARMITSLGNLQQRPAVPLDLRDQFRLSGLDFSY